MMLVFRKIAWTHKKKGWQLVLDSYRVGFKFKLAVFLATIIGVTI